MEFFTIKTDFSFLKAFEEIDKHLSAVTGEMSEEVVESAAKLINSKGVTPKLKPSTLKRRRAKGNSDDTPLKDTGNLVDTMKVIKDGVQFAEYGIYHQEGIGVPRRRFLPFTPAWELDKAFSPEWRESKDRIELRLINRIQKSMKKGKKS